MEKQEIRIWFLVEAKDFSPLYSIQTGPETYAVFYRVDASDSFHWNNVARASS
jgi:hypothetical protein